MNRHALTVPYCHGEPMTISRAYATETVYECLFCGERRLLDTDRGVMM